MGAFGGNFYSMPKPAEGQSEQSLNDAPITPSAVETPPYERYADQDSASFAPSPATAGDARSRWLHDPSFEPEIAATPAPAQLNIAAVAIGLGFLLWVMSRSEY